MLQNLFRASVPAAILLALLAGCGTAPTGSGQNFQPTLVVEGYLKAGAPVDSVYVGSTVPLYETYSRETGAISNAAVTLQVDGQSFSLVPAANAPGYYGLSTLTVQPGKTYQLTVSTTVGTAQAETTVPVPPQVSAPTPDLQISGNPIQVSWNGPTQAGYITARKVQILGDAIPVTTQFTFDPGRLVALGVDTTGFGARLDSLAAVRDSLAQAEQWRFVQDQSTTLDAREFTHYGTYDLLVYAIDKNYADYLASSQQDPQALDEPRTHVTGGVGLFASMAADSVSIVVSP